MFVVMIMKTKQKVSVRNCEPPLEQDINICWADGMSGALPVFEDREDAEKYANGAEVVEVEEKFSDPV